ncbi:hypothetical protein Tco_1537559 [Tanacetum coccineum]
MFDVSDLAGEEVFIAEQGVSDKDVNLSVDRVTLAQALAILKSVKVQEKANVVEEPSESITTTPTLTTTTAATITDMLNKKLKADYWNEMCYQLLKLITKQLKNQIVGIKSFLLLFGVTAALIDVNAAQSKLVLLENFNENYSKCLRLLLKLPLLEEVTTARGSYYC